MIHNWYATWWTCAGWKTSGTFLDISRDDLEKVIMESGGTIIDFHTL